MINVSYSEQNEVKYITQKGMECLTLILSPRYSEPDLITPNSNGLIYL